MESNVDNIDPKKAINPDLNNKRGIFITKLHLGFWILKRGDCSFQVENSEDNVINKISAIMNISRNNVGNMYLEVKMELFESCIVPETKSEHMKLEK